MLKKKKERKTNIGKKNNYSLFIYGESGEEGHTADPQQTKGKERYESYLPCNGVCLSWRIQSLLASNKNKTDVKN